LLELRRDHAAARDAVLAEFDPIRDLEPHFPVVAGSTLVELKTEFLLRPDRGRRLAPATAERIRQQCPGRTDLQLVIGDGLSVPAVLAQVPPLVPLLLAGAAERGWSLGRIIALRYCRVGVLNDIGELLDPAVVVLLIGERPGLATAESLSAYMAYRPRPGHTDADRNLISNIHARGVSHADAARRILDLTALLMRRQASGVTVKEDSN
jgi:ethanolamine ammonia-lyase small subunit